MLLPEKHIYPQPPIINGMGCCPLWHDSFVAVSKTHFLLSLSSSFLCGGCGAFSYFLQRERERERESFCRDVFVFMTCIFHR